MQGYNAIEDGVRNELLRVFASELSATTCSIGDIDTVFAGILASDSPYGCVIDFFKGAQDSHKPFSSPVWVWTVGCVFLVRYDGSEDTTTKNIRSIVDKIATELFADHTLGGISTHVLVTGIDAPTPEKINDIPFYWMFFSVEALDK